MKSLRDQDILRQDLLISSCERNGFIKFGEEMRTMKIVKQHPSQIQKEPMELVVGYNDMLAWLYEDMTKSVRDRMCLKFNQVKIRVKEMLLAQKGRFHMNRHHL